MAYNYMKAVVAEGPEIPAMWSASYVSQGHRLPLKTMLVPDHDTGLLLFKAGAVHGARHKGRQEEAGCRFGPLSSTGASDDAHETPIMCRLLEKSLSLASSDLCRRREQNTSFVK